MENFIQKARKKKSISIFISSVVFLFFVIVFIIDDDISIYNWIGLVSFYVFVLNLIHQIDKPLEEIEDLYIRGHFIRQSEALVENQGFILKKQTRSKKVFINPQIPWYKVRKIVFRKQNESILIIRGQKKYLKELEKYRIVLRRL